MTSTPRTHPAVGGYRPWLAWLCLLVLCGIASVAAAQAPARDFDHLSTGFALTGMHSPARCETCHLGGVFKGTPRDCETCHVTGSRFAKANVVKHTGHIPTTLACDACHNTRAFTGARMDHTGVAKGACTTCHNGTLASGKPSSHPATTAACDLCHSATAWRPVSNFDHTGVAAGTCASCHNGGKATGMGARHTPFTQVGAIAGTACDTCHKSGFRAWTPAKLHGSVNVTAQCATCHVGLKPANTVHAGQTACEDCHRSTSGWAGTKVDHSRYTVATDCASCHNGSGATGKGNAHIPVGGANCGSCHSSSGWKPSRWDHTQISVSAQCASCHTGNFPPAEGKSATHVPYTQVAAMASLNCDSCHKSGFTLWTGAKLHTSVALTALCATCHTSIKPGNATHSGQTTCEGCHKSTSTWSSGKVDHSTFNAATQCASCHTGSGGVTGKNSSHVPVGSTNCFACHSPVQPWKPSSFNHTQVSVTAQCATCHTGSYPPADGKNASHTPYTLTTAGASANCDTCHKSGYTLWTGAKVHTSLSIAAQCATCHVAIKPNNATHSGQTTCENCHKSTSTWSSGKVDHSTFSAATSCASCHNGSGGVTGKGATHIPVGSTNCYACHSPVKPWKPSSFNHTQVPVTAQCATCHTGSYPPADGKSASHTPYQLTAAGASANCDTCHKSGYTLWTGAKVHAGLPISTQCATCHAGIKPTNATHLGQTTCEGCHKSTATWSSGKVDHSTFGAATNCASCHNGSGGVTGKPATHIPVGSTNCYACHSPVKPWKPSSFNHTQVPVTAQCATCHTGSYPPADGKSASHTPYQLTAAGASANCDTCHKSGYTLWTGAKVHGNLTLVAQCATCHAGIKPNNATHLGQTTCEGCHKSTITWTGAKVDHSTLTAATNCASCHNGSGGVTGKPATHIPVGSTNCYACHSPVKPWKPSSFNHTQVPVTAQCATCHTGNYPPADGKASSHIPYQLITGAATANCDTCHKAGYTAWVGGKFHAYVTSTGQCKTCHISTYASQGPDVKPTNHIPEAQLLNGAAMECNACHKSVTAWTYQMNHNSSMGGGAGWCKGCHASSTPYSANMEKKSLTHRTKTPAAIDCSESGCHKPLGNRGTTFQNWD